MKDLNKLSAKDLVDHIFGFGDFEHNVKFLILMIENETNEELKNIYKEKLRELKEGA